MYIRNLLSTLGMIGVLLCALVGQARASVPVLHLGNGGEPRDLDPHIVTGVPEFHIIQNVFEGLVGKDPKTLEPTTAAAQSWKISDDGRVYTFKIRPNAKWTNGDPLTAEDFVYSVRRLVDPKTASEYAQQMGFYIKNGKGVFTGEIKDFSKLGVKALDQKTLEITLENPVPFFLGLLYHHSMLPVHRPTIEKFGQRWTRPENIVSNGAFILTNWEINKAITIKKSPNYWDKDKVKLEQANFYPVEKEDTEEKMFRANELHVTNQVPLEKIPTWQKDKSGVYLQHPYLGTYFYRINTKRPPLDKKEVRQALALAIDREKIVKLVTRGGQLPGTTFTPPGIGGYHPTPRLPKDGGGIAKAKELLAKAGYPDGKGFPEIDLLYNTSDSHKKIAEVIQQMWKQNLGINIKLFNQEWKVYLDNERTFNYSISRAGWVADYNDPNNFLDMFITGGGNNKTGWSNPKYDQAIDQAAAVAPVQFKNVKDLKKQARLLHKKRFEFFQQAEDILLDELPVIPIYIYSRVYLKSPKIVGWYPNIEDIHPLKFVSLAP